MNRNEKLSAWLGWQVNFAVELFYDGVEEAQCKQMKADLLNSFAWVTGSKTIKKTAEKAEKDAQEYKKNALLIPATFLCVSVPITVVYWAITEGVARDAMASMYRYVFVPNGNNAASKQTKNTEKTAAAATTKTAPTSQSNEATSSKIETREGVTATAIGTSAPTTESKYSWWPAVYLASVVPLYVRWWQTSPSPASNVKLPITSKIEATQSARPSAPPPPNDWNNLSSQSLELKVPASTKPVEQKSITPSAPPMPTDEDSVPVAITINDTSEKVPYAIAIPAKPRLNNG